MDNETRAVVIGALIGFIPFILNLLSTLTISSRTREWQIDDHKIEDAKKISGQNVQHIIENLNKIREEVLRIHHEFTTQNRIKGPPYETIMKINDIENVIDQIAATISDRRINVLAGNFCSNSKLYFELFDPERSKTVDLELDEEHYYGLLTKIFFDCSNYLNKALIHEPYIIVNQPYNNKYNKVAFFIKKITRKISRHGKRF
jgi:hypothetical protein